MRLRVERETGLERRDIQLGSPGRPRSETYANLGGSLGQVDDTSS